ncbi:YagE family protein [Histoplasma capsulatum G186AR]|uniref:YagE family protein n=2 Tax=Ajellomyces capsulatus TaxID=5037 RepID=C0NW70_AJECG|nr:YagE family protein [Histoplasma capsulatum G186AR]EEH04175.1 YagE family protein [Histoplasma capsulatum G186AR]KAG5291124.1 YagE family protein [Histoplasma capsulatum]QSS68427.1 YagE family protein [Histoplasma capsulatum G186AR]
MFARRLLSSGCRARQITPTLSRFDHTLSPSSRPTNFPQWRKEFFSSKINHQHAKPETPSDAEAASTVTQKQKRKLSRSPAAKISLRRVAVEAQRSKDGMRQKAQAADEDLARSKTVTAYAVAETFDLAKVVQILLSKGYEPDPFKTDLYPQVVHVQVPLDSLRRTASPSASDLSPEEAGDIFIFPSGTVVAWALPDNFVSYLATSVLFPAAENPHVDSMETEDLDYIEDPNRENSSIKGDTITLGTKISPDSRDLRVDGKEGVDNILTKIAFSSGLARSTKLAVLETLLSNYFESTRNIPTLLSKGTHLPFTRRFVLQKTGQLLSVRAQLNLYSELTDSLPDLFWDSRHELGLEGYYDQVGRALDVGIRIKVLNEKMDYAQEIASVLRERLSETHGLRLEWIIIALIAVEVGFEVLRLWKEKKQHVVEVVESTERTGR